MGYGLKVIIIKMKKKYYQVANLVFTISGSDEGFYNALANYFSDKEIKEHSTKPMLDIIVSRDLKYTKDFIPDYYSLSGKIAFNHSSFSIKKKWCRYVVSDLFNQNSPTRVVFEPKSCSWLYSQAVKIGSAGVGNHNKYDLFVNDIAGYNCLWYIFAITLMKYGQLFVHCGMMSKETDNEGIILTGTGGCGKTSIMMELITNSGYRYMAEDFGIVDKSGNLYDMQKKAAIYQSDVKWGNRYLKAAITKLKYTQRIEWMLKKYAKRNPRHYFKPSELFGEEISHKAHLKKVFFLKRTNIGSEITCKSLSSNQVAEQTKTASFREIKEIYEILGNIRAVGGDNYYNDYPSVYELEKRYKDILIEGLNNVECYELVVPSDLTPKAAVKYIVANDYEV